MRKKITFFMINSAGAELKQFSVTKNILFYLLIFALTGGIVCCYLIYDYYKLNKTLVSTNSLKDKISDQANNINSQNQQIQLFAKQVNTLKKQIVELGNFEKKIRVIANIDNKNEDKQIFGIGGFMPPDLDGDLDLEEKHNSLSRDIHEQIDQLGQAVEIQKEGFSFLIKSLELQRNVLASTPSIRPCEGWVSSKFGYRISPFTGRRVFHKGLDMANHVGTKVVSTANGIVTFRGIKGLLGNTVVIDHGHGMITRYGHLNKFYVKMGTKVKRGDKIAGLGNTGRSTGPHLHYEVRLNGIPVNPLKYIMD